MDISSLRERRAAEFTVSELNGYIKTVFDNDRSLPSVTVCGEISNLVCHGSGHLYFSLKDSDGQIKAVMFRSYASKLKTVPKNGMRIKAHGSVSVYPQGGVYQLYVTSMIRDGIGELYEKYELLKSRLAEEGLFSSEHKKAIPRFPEAIGIITSPTGAAVRDIINITERRFPYARIYLYPSLVQGENAESDLIKALDFFESARLVDVIIIGRGGGSIEDLWSFNSEALARRIYSHSVPIISAVGHETDFTVCDFVSDVRAPTPSAAAELAVPDSAELLMRIDSLSERAASALKKNIVRMRERLEAVKDKAILKNPEIFYKEKKQAASDLAKRACELVRLRISNKRNGLMLNVEGLNALNPLSVLARGYAVVESEGGCIRRMNDVDVGDVVTVRISDGKFKAKILEKEVN